MMVIIADGVIRGCAGGSIDHDGESELPGLNHFCPCYVTLLVNLSHHSGRNLETILPFHQCRSDKETMKMAPVGGDREVFTRGGWVTEGRRRRGGWVMEGGEEGRRRRGEAG